MVAPAAGTGAKGEPAEWARGSEATNGASKPMEPVSPPAPASSVPPQTTGNAEKKGSLRGLLGKCEIL